jgi:hypothetical protein
VGEGDKVGLVLRPVLLISHQEHLRCFLARRR